MSIKLRTVLWFTLMVFLISALVLVIVLVINGNSITPDPEERLVRTVMKNARRVEFDNGRFEWHDLIFYKRGISCTFYNADGERLRGAVIEGVDYESLPLEADKLRSFKAGEEEYLCYDTCVDMNISRFWIRGVINSADRSGLMHVIMVLTFTLLPAILLLTLGGGYLIVWASFRPMDKILSAAESISGGSDLSARIGLKRGPSEMIKLSHSFDRMIGRLEDSFEAERQFASDASHELRTPISVILAQCERSQRKDKSPEDYENSIGVIREQSLKMKELVQDLLSITRLQHGTDRYKLENGSLSDFLNALAQDFTPDENKNIRFEARIQDDIELPFNAGLMARAVGNLIQNACKYGKDGGYVRLSLKKNGDTAEISVADDGIGIAPGDISKVFNRFWQADTSRSEDGSSGLGLSMVKEIAEFHGGSVSVKSTPQKGSEFTIRI